MEIVADSTLGTGDFAATLGGQPGSAGRRVRTAEWFADAFLMVWRREPDGRWRIARELLNEDV